MKNAIPSEVVEALAAVGAAHGATGPIHVQGVRVCEHCQDDNKEAHPYGVYDARGKWWDDLCNECFDALGCSYETESDELSDDEQCALYHEQQAWADVNNEWVKAGKKCGCGNPISLEDAFHFGCCDNCRHQEIPF